MSIKTEPASVNFNGWTGLYRPAGQAPARLLLMLHGWKGDETSMWVFARNIPAHLAVLSLRAPHPATGGGWSWRPVDPTTHGYPRFDQLRPSADALVHFVDEWSAAIGLDARVFDVIGFSQGGAMTCTLGLLYPQRIARMGVLAGFVPAGADDLVAAQPLAGKPVFVAHGTQDELVPVERARESIAALEQAGARIEYCEAPVGHRVSADCLRGLHAFLAA